MIKHDMTKVNLDNPLEGKIPQLIEYFVKFYGEKYRERITERINNATFVFASVYIGEIERDFGGMKASYDEDITEKLEKFLKEKYDAKVLDEDGYYNVLDAKDWAKMRTKADRKDLVEYLNCFSNFKGTTIEDLQDEQKKGKIKEFLDGLFERTDDLLKQRDAFLREEKKEYEKIIYGKMQKIEKEFENKLNLLISGHIFKTYNIKFTPKNVKEVLKLVPTYVDLLIKNPEFVTDFDRDKYGFMFFKIRSLGGDSLTSYRPLNMKQLLTLKADDDNIQLEQEISRLQERKAFELSNLYVPYEELEKKNIVGYRYFLVDAINTLRCDEAGALTYLTVSKDDPKKTQAVCVFNSFYNLSSSDIIHELNHVIEADVKVTKNVMSIKTGFRYTKQYVDGGEYGDIFYPDIRHDATMFNEIINDYLAIKINKILVKDNFKIGDVKLPTTSSAYSDLFPIFEDFIEENMQEIIRCRMSSKPLLYNRAIGEENFQKLAYYAQKIFDLYERYYVVSEELDKEHICDEINRKRGNQSIFEFAKNHGNDVSAEAKEVLEYVKKIEKVFNKIKRERQSSRENRNKTVNGKEDLFDRDQIIKYDVD